MNEHNIDNFMKLASYCSSDEDRESEADHYYRGVYEKIASGNKFSFNWCAFLFNASWCLYRKMYLYGVLWLVLMFLYGECINYIAIHTIGVASYDALPNKIKFILFPLQIAPSILFGFIGNWLYVQQVHKKIDQGHHLSNVRNTDKLTWSFTAVLSVVFCIGIAVFHGFSSLKTGYMHYIPTVLNVLLASILGFITVMYDKRKVKAALAECALVVEGGSSPSE
jgi:hypothetical protein